MRLVIASLMALIFGVDARALAQAPNPPDIRVTQRDYPLVGVEMPPVTRPPECGVLHRPRTGTAPPSRGEVMEERRRMANSWMIAPSPPVNPRSIYCGVIPSASDPMPLSQTPARPYEEQLRGAKRGFALYDLNHDGVISRKEWSTLEARAAAPIPGGKSRAQYTCALDQEFKLIDSNHDGKITFAEFIADNFGKNRHPIRGCY